MAQTKEPNILLAKQVAFTALVVFPQQDRLVDDEGDPLARELGDARKALLDSYDFQPVIRTSP